MFSFVYILLVVWGDSTIYRVFYCLTAVMRFCLSVPCVWCVVFHAFEGETHLSPHLGLRKKFGERVVCLRRGLSVLPVFTFLVTVIVRTPSFLVFLNLFLKPFWALRSVIMVLKFWGFYGFTLALIIFCM